MIKFKSTALACLVAPLAVMPVIVVYMVVTGDAVFAFGATLFALAIAYVGVVVIGVPFHWLASWLQIETVKFYAAIGFSIPALIIVVTPVLQGEPEGLLRSGLQGTLVLFGLSGMSVASSFRLVVDWTSDRPR